MIDISVWLNSLIGSELVASLQYEIASHVVVGVDYDTCNSEFKQHADEEREHMNRLLELAIERDIEINQDLISLIQMSNPAYEIMSAKSSKELVQFHFDAEEKAIKTYREFYNLIKEDDITLAKEIKIILADEIEHRKDLKKISSSINEGNEISIDKSIYASFSKLTERLSKLKWGLYDLL